MMSFEQLSAMGHEQVIYFSDPSCGLKAIVAIHNTTLGPALGGLRLWPYKNEEEALTDVLRLSKGMTYKAAISGLNLGGGKSVIIGDPKDKSEALFRSFGRFIESLNGRYITAEDVNIGVEDIEHIFTETSNVTGVAEVHGGSGNPSPYTALGVLRGIEASCLKVYGNKSVRGKVVAVQGAGSVGTNLIKYLLDEGATVYFTDINDKNVQKVKDTLPQAKFVSAEELINVTCDIFSPCALGAGINDQTVEKLKCKIVAGAANNQLKEDVHGEILKKRGILYAPDYLINAGGLMNVSIEFEGHSPEKARRMINTIFDKTIQVFKLSEDMNIPVNKAADRMADQRIHSIKQIKNTYLGNVSHRFPGRKRRNLI